MLKKKTKKTQNQRTVNRFLRPGLRRFQSTVRGIIARRRVRSGPQRFLESIVWMLAHLSWVRMFVEFNRSSRVRYSHRVLVRRSLYLLVLDRNGTLVNITNSNSNRVPFFHLLRPCGWQLLHPCMSMPMLCCSTSEARAMQELYSPTRSSQKSLVECMFRTVYSCQCDVTVSSFILLQVE